MAKDKKNRLMKGHAALSKKAFQKARKRAFRRLKRGFSPVIGKDNLPQAIRAALGAL
jgi:hypothetical protein